MKFLYYVGIIIGLTALGMIVHIVQPGRDGEENTIKYLIPEVENESFKKVLENDEVDLEEVFSKDEGDTLEEGIVHIFNQNVPEIIDNQESDHNKSHADTLHTYNLHQDQRLGGYMHPMDRFEGFNWESVSSGLNTLKRGDVLVRVMFDYAATILKREECHFYALDLFRGLCNDIYSFGKVILQNSGTTLEFDFSNSESWYAGFHGGSKTEKTTELFLWLNGECKINQNKDWIGFERNYLPICGLNIDELGDPIGAGAPFGYSIQLADYSDTYEFCSAQDYYLKRDNRRTYDYDGGVCKIEKIMIGPHYDYVEDGILITVHDKEKIKEIKGTGLQ